MILLQSNHSGRLQKPKGEDFLTKPLPFNPLFLFHLLSYGFVLKLNRRRENVDEYCFSVFDLTEEYGRDENVIDIA